MATLSKHQILHLNAVINDAVKHNDKYIDFGEIKSLATAKGVVLESCTSYLNVVRAKASEILSTGIWPKGLENPSDIHDYLEKKLFTELING